ncbi:MAG TPA: sulfatase [Bacteroidales bacterium]|nr:sulfatase [Bacteroidales bacterium]
MKKLFIIILFVITVEINAREKITERPNILWIVCEDISPYIGVYGDDEVKTPNIDQLAKEGIRYTHVYTVAGVSAPSRSGIITGMYPTSIGTQHMRTAGDPQYQPVPPYSAVIPEYVKCFPEYLRAEGYYCTNNEKQDYQFTPPVTVWDENGPAASFINRQQDKPFFAVYNFFITHESQIFSRNDSLLVDPASVTVPPIYPDTKTVRHDIARMLTNIERMDSEVGELLEMLKKDGSYDNTIIFFYSDHGGVLPWMKREILERGTHIPLIIRFPGNKNRGTVNADMISSVDFAPTVLSLAGIPVPGYMQGQAFLGSRKAVASRKYVFAGRDRMDTEYDRVRMVRDKHFRYLYNYYPEKSYYQDIEYRLGIPMMKELLTLRNEGKLDTIQAKWFKTKPKEELYDVDSDPWETRNLVNDPAYRDKLNEMRTAFREWNKKVGDMGNIPEAEMIKKMWNGNSEPPVTMEPEIKRSGSGYRIMCSTPGASVGYRIIKADQINIPETHMIRTWDAKFAFGFGKNGTPQAAYPAWNVYKGEVISLEKNDTLLVDAMRIGYQPALLKYCNDKIIR